MKEKGLTVNFRLAIILVILLVYAILGTVMVCERRTTAVEELPTKQDLIRGLSQTGNITTMVTYRGRNDTTYGFCALTEELDIHGKPQANIVGVAYEPNIPREELMKIAGVETFDQARDLVGKAMSFLWNYAHTTHPPAKADQTLPRRDLGNISPEDMVHIGQRIIAEEERASKGQAF